MQLKDYVGEFEALGVNVVAISYDSHESNAEFEKENQLTYSLLSDQSAATVKGLGILNEDYEPGHRAYGIPHPGVLFVSSDATIALKRAVPSYRERPEFDEILEAVRQLTRS